MENLRTLGVAFAMALCAALVAGPGLAQENAQTADAPKVGSDRDAPRGEGAGTGGGGAIKGGAEAKGNDPGGDRGASQSRPREGGFHAGPGTDANRKGTNGGTPGTAPGVQGVALDHGINLIRPDDGYAGLQRRANRKTLIANAPRKPAGQLANPGANPQFTDHGAGGGPIRNAVGTVMPGGGQGSGPHVPGLVAHTGIGANGPGAGATGAGVTGISAVGVGTAATGSVGGVDPHRPTIPLNTVTGPATHAAGINGTTMGHVASGPSYIGGPAKDRSGINGTAMRPKH